MVQHLSLTACKCLWSVWICFNLQTLLRAEMRQLEHRKAQRKDDNFSHSPHRLRSHEIHRLHSLLSILRNLLASQTPFVLHLSLAENNLRLFRCLLKKKKKRSAALAFGLYRTRI